MNDPACIYCGCTEDRACPGGCSWVRVTNTPKGATAPRFCSACVDLAAHLQALVYDLAQDRRLAKIPGGLGMALLTFLCETPTGPQLRLDRWAVEAVCEGPHGRAVFPVLRQGRKTPSSPAPATPRKASFPVSHTPPRRKGRVSRQPRGAR